MQKRGPGKHAHIDNYARGCVTLHQPPCNIFERIVSRLPHILVKQTPERRRGGTPPVPPTYKLKQTTRESATRSTDKTRQHSHVRMPDAGSRARCTYVTCRAETPHTGKQELEPRPDNTLHNTATASYKQARHKARRALLAHRTRTWRSRPEGHFDFSTVVLL